MKKNLMKSEMNRFISTTLDDVIVEDTIFYFASMVTKSKELMSIDVDSSNCLVTMRQTPRKLPTVAELRIEPASKITQDNSVIYHGKVLLSAGIILSVNNKVLMFQRDSGAPVDPFKWTNPAGRCDREPYLASLKEFYEEIILFDSVSGKPVFVNFHGHKYSLESKEIYQATLTRKGFSCSPDEWFIVDANFEHNDSLFMQSVQTNFYSTKASVDCYLESFSGKFFPYMDEQNNTLELQLICSIKMPENSAEFNLSFCDGEYERPARLFTKEDFKQMDDSLLVPAMANYRNALIANQLTVMANAAEEENVDALEDYYHDLACGIGVG